MARAWQAAATAFAALAVAALPLLALVPEFVDGLDKLPPTAWLIGIPLSSAATGLSLGWWSRPRWLFLPAFLLAAFVLILGLRLTSEPCPPDALCEGFTPQASVLLLGMLGVWPWALLGAAGTGLAGHLRGKVGQGPGGWRSWLRELGGISVYLLAGLLLAWFVINYPA